MLRNIFRTTDENRNKKHITSYFFVVCSPSSSLISLVWYYVHFSPIVLALSSCWLLCCCWLRVAALYHMLIEAQNVLLYTVSLSTHSTHYSITQSNKERSVFSLLQAFYLLQHAQKTVQYIWYLSVIIVCAHGDIYKSYIVLRERERDDTWWYNILSFVFRISMDDNTTQQKHWVLWWYDMYVIFNIREIFSLELLGAQRCHVYT